MARPKLNSILPEIIKYVGLPYFINSASNSNQTEDVFVGKGTAHEIALKTIELANHNRVDLRQLSPSALYTFQKKHRLGIDCSGLVFHLLQLVYPGIEKILVGTENKKGVRRLSANLLTSPPNAFPLPQGSSPQLGDLIRIDSGRHVIFILESDHQHLHYIHSAQRTKTAGVHFGQITLTNPDLDLNHQLWSDTLKNGQPYSHLYHPELGDGLFRVKF